MPDARLVTHDPRHWPGCWCRWAWAQDRWGPSERDADSEDTPEDIAPDRP